MGECRHTCCVGWEIDVDEDSLARYRALPEKWRQFILSRIDESNDPPCFRLTEEERCPFLNENGLCEMIIHLGENSLCQICADHPRFRNFFSDRVEVGLGLCCEAAGQLILAQEAPAQLIVAEDDGDDDPLTEEEESLLTLRGKLIALMQDRSLSFPERLNRMQEEYLPSMPAFDAAYWADFLLTLERLDDAWADQLNRLSSGCGCASLPDIPFEQLTVYLLFRHLPAALDDGDIRGRLAYVLLIARLLPALAQANAGERGISMDALTELARLYSSEIEYSDENITAVIDELYRLGL